MNVNDNQIKASGWGKVNEYLRTEIRKGCGWGDY